jgi:RND family efflux transporter MFP subunit
MPSRRIQARKMEAPATLEEKKHVSTPLGANEAVGVVTDLPSAIDPTRRRSRALWPWLVGAVLTGVAALGWFAPWVDTSVPTTAATGQGVAVLCVPIELGDMRVRRRYPGELFADAVEVTSRLAGHVAQMPVRIGDPVQLGQVLTRLDDAVLRRRVRETEAQIRAQRSMNRNAGIAVEAAQRDVTRARGLVPSGAVSKQELDELETALRQREAEQATARAQFEEAKARLAVLKEDLTDTAVRAPFAGVVARRDVDVGAFVQPGMPMLRLVAQEPLRIRFRVPEYELDGLAPGMGIELDTRHLSGTRAKGTVTRLSGEVSATDRTLVVEGVVDEHEGLRPGMYADVVLQMQELEGARIVPGAAVVERVDSGGRASTGVFVLEPALEESELASARWVDVRVLGRDGDRVAIEPERADGSIDDDAQVLVRGHRELADGARVRLVETVEGGGA